MNIMVRRNDFLSIAGFNEHLETTEDVNLCYRLAQREQFSVIPAWRLSTGVKRKISELSGVKKCGAV
jgi:hypothetical protein